MEKAEGKEEDMVHGRSKLRNRPSQILLLKMLEINCNQVSLLLDSE